MVAISPNSGQILSTLRAKGVQLAAVDGGLAWSAPEGTITSAWANLIDSYAEELFELLELETIINSRSENAVRSLLGERAKRG